MADKSRFHPLHNTAISYRQSYFKGKRDNIVKLCEFGARVDILRPTRKGAVFIAAQARLE